MNMCWRTMLTTLVAMLAISAMATGITLGGRRAFYDRSTDTWLCSVPQSLFGQDWTSSSAFRETAQAEERLRAQREEYESRLEELRTKISELNGLLEEKNGIISSQKGIIDFFERHAEK